MSKAEPLGHRMRPARTVCLKGSAYCPSTLRRRAVEKRWSADPTIPTSSAFMVTSTRNRPIHHNRYMRLYSMIEETGKPLAWHSGFNWGDPSFAQLNRFISMHALSFVHYSLIHMTNWIINGLPERFPKLKMLWVESGCAWISIPNAAPRPRIHDALIRGAGAQTTAERIYATTCTTRPNRSSVPTRRSCSARWKRSMPKPSSFSVRAGRIGISTPFGDHDVAIPVQSGRARSSWS